jgi:hypothetical protein
MKNIKKFKCDDSEDMWWLMFVCWNLLVSISVSVAVIIWCLQCYVFSFLVHCWWNLR